MSIRQNIRNKRAISGPNKGFTLIELLIVIGIIALLVGVLSVALFSWISKADEQATEALLSSVGPALASMNPKPTLKRFKKDAGDLSKQISSDKDIASSQMILFYLAPDLETWNRSRLYKGREYSPQITPETLQANISGSKTLKYLVDQNGDPFRLLIESGKVYVIARGEDGKFNTEDDVLYHGPSEKVKSGIEVGLK